MIPHETIGLLNPSTGDIVYSLVRHRLGECPLCDRARNNRVAREFQRRLDVSGVSVSSLHMWSLGCSLRDSRSNRKVLSGWWRQFTESMKRTGWVPCFRILEVGKRGYLHFHVVVSGFVEHAVILQKWRSITGEKSNVNVSAAAGDSSHMVRYLTKYLSKGNGGACPGSYRWLGPLYGVPSAPPQGEVQKLQYMGNTCYSGPSVSEYRPRQSQRKID